MDSKKNKLRFIIPFSSKRFHGSHLRCQKIPIRLAFCTASGEILLAAWRKVKPQEPFEQGAGGMKYWLRAALFAGATLAGAATAHADDWIGRWGAPGCGPDGTVIVLSRKQLDLSTFEATCRVSNVRQGRGSYELQALCTGEGRPVKVGFTVSADRNSLTFLRQQGMEFTPKRFRRCS